MTELSLHHLLSPDVLADPYPLYDRLRTESPVHFDPYLHVWVVTRYADVVDVLNRLSAERTPGPDRLRELGMARLAPVAEVMVRQMLFVDPPEHTRLRALYAAAFTPRRVEGLRADIAALADELLDRVAEQSGMDVLADFAAVLPAMVTARVLGVPIDDHLMLKAWSETFAEVLGNFQHNPDRAHHLLRGLEEMLAYFRDAVRRPDRSREGLVAALVDGEVEGRRLSEDEIVANLVLTMVGGQETTTNLIGNGVLTLLRHPDQLRRLHADPGLFPSAVEELLRFESPSQHTARVAKEDVEIGGTRMRRGQAVVAVLGAANRDPSRFPDPGRLDLGRADNRHLAFGWSAHFCFGAGLARTEGLVALRALLGRFPGLRAVDMSGAWRANLGLRGLEHLWVTWRD
ncbi:cytochrome P450 [Saccharothrix deserti]|uniref:cytochrome P450 n=1 Tax=Saccharothrix deserti TaxID=2593674 RepID=UPI00131D5AA6|nr:cytochrome P450 [Saccharothrix deserti]